MIFILLSIKTRIETAPEENEPIVGHKFLLYYPLKQGLKLKERTKELSHGTMFLLYYPLKQGLKLNKCSECDPITVVFTLLSIKTRIETPFSYQSTFSSLKFLLYYPLKQGLKLSDNIISNLQIIKFLLYYPLKQGLKHTITFYPNF